MLILKSLTSGQMHGWGISQRIQEVSREALRVNQGSLYPALHRLEQKDWIEAEWGTSANNRRAKFYRLSAAGRRQLKAEERAWRRFAKGVELVLALG
jgi:transcriptional regulator